MYWLSDILRQNVQLKLFQYLLLQYLYGLWAHIKYTYSDFKDKYVERIINHRYSNDC